MSFDFHEPNQEKTFGKLDSDLDIFSEHGQVAFLILHNKSPKLTQTPLFFQKKI